MWRLEDVEVLGEGRIVSAAVSERRPTPTVMGGTIPQRFQLLLPSGERLDPPVRVAVRGLMLRVLGTQAPPFAGEPSLVTCERALLDLPDTVNIVAPGTRAMNTATGRFAEGGTAPWSGAAHVASGAPAAIDVAGEDAPLDRVTVTLPLDAPYAAGHEVHVASSRTPGLSGAVFRLSGEVLDSTADARRVIGYRLGV